jgi:uncharacterized protein (TIGR03435 family)
MNRALISALISLPFAAAVSVAQSPISPRPLTDAGVHKAVATTAGVRFQPVLGAIRVDSVDIPFEVKVEPSTLDGDSSSIDAGADHWEARGYDLKSLIAELFAMDARLVDVPEGLVAGGARYDVSLSAPVELDQDSMQRVLMKALNQSFGLTIQPEERTMDVYVLSAPQGAATGLKRHTFPRRSGLKSLVSADDTADDAGGRITYMGQDCSGVNSGGITVEGGTIADFRRTLEPDLDRVLLDETGLRGSYDFKIGLYANQRQLFELMHVALGLVVTPEQRKVTVLSVRPAESQPSAGMLQAKL